MAEQPLSQTPPDVYANIVNFGTTVWDLRLNFGQMIKREEQEQFESRVSVTLPWLQAKIMSVYLQYLCQLGKAEGGLSGMNTAQAGDLVENLGK